MSVNTKFKQKEILEYHGILLPLYMASISSKMRNILYQGNYENNEMHAVERKLKKNDIVLELGTGIGFIATLCSKIAKEVYTYEANPYMIETIMETFKINKVKPLLQNYILCDKESEMDFFINEDFWTSSCFDLGDNKKKISVRTKILNDEIKKINPTFLIVDIEGFEKKIFEYIDYYNINNILIDLHPCEIGNSICTKIINKIINSGYTIDFPILDSVIFFARNP
jgi:FkbM family methyltransferase